MRIKDKQWKRKRKTITDEQWKRKRKRTKDNGREGSSNDRADITYNHIDLDNIDSPLNQATWTLVRFPKGIISYVVYK